MLSPSTDGSGVIDDIRPVLYQDALTGNYLQK